MLGVRFKISVKKEVKEECKIARVHQCRVEYIAIANMTLDVWRVLFGRVGYPVDVATEDHLSDLQDRY